MNEFSESKCHSRCTPFIQLVLDKVLESHYRRSLVSTHRKCKCISSRQYFRFEQISLQECKHEPFGITYLQKDHMYSCIQSDFPFGLNTVQHISSGHTRGPLGRLNSALPFWYQQMFVYVCIIDMGSTIFQTISAHYTASVPVAIVCGVTYHWCSTALRTPRSLLSLFCCPSCSRNVVICYNDSSINIYLMGNVSLFVPLLKKVGFVFLRQEQSISFAFFIFFLQWH